MKKALIFIILNFILLQNEAFATIQKTTEAVLRSQKTVPHLSFKQRFFTYLIQRKIRRLNTKQPNLFAQKDSSGRECVTIKLKNGQSIAATIIRMDDQNITYKHCDPATAVEGTVQTEQVISIMDAQKRMIFNNQPQVLKTGKSTSGDKNALASITALSVAFVSVISTFFALLVLNFEEETPIIVDVLVSLIILGVLVSFVTGIISLILMTITPPKQKNSKFLAILSSIISGLAVALILLTVIL